MKGKPKLPDFTTERERNIRKRSKIYYLASIIFAILSIGGIIVYGLNQERLNASGLLFIYEGLVFIGMFLFRTITWKRLGWEQISSNELDIYKITKIENKERQKEQETELMIIDFVLGVTSIVFIIIGIVKLV